MLETNSWEWFIGAFLVLIHAQGRFNTPKTNRTTTTTARYYMAFAGYLLTLAFFYVLLGGGLGASQYIFLFMTSGGGTPADVQDLPGPLLAALVLTTLLPNFPVLSKFDEWLRQRFQDIGNIPWAARHLSARMRKDNAGVPSELQADTRQLMPGFSPEDMHFEEGDALQHQWTKAASFMARIRLWRSTRKYARFVEVMKEDYEEIEMEFERVRPLAQRCFERIRLSDSPGEVEECSRNLRENLEGMKKKMCEFLARGVLRCNPTRMERRQELESLGLSDCEETHQPLTANQIVTISLIVFILIFAGSLLGDRSGIGRILFTATMVATIYGFAVIAAIHPKTSLPLADIRKTMHRPMVFYLLSGVLAAILAFFVALTFRYVFYANFIQALLHIRLNYPWFLLTFVLAVVVSFLADDYALRNEPEPEWLRWSEGGITAAILALTAWVVSVWFQEIQSSQAEILEGIRWARSVDQSDIIVRNVKPWVLIPVSTIIGFFIGSFVPHWFRHAPVFERRE